ncbi:UNVERIFIED_CONTAM: Helicase-like transcription factor CHR28 [Sesamum latifolium]|uniref:Helicase-like transcription factor CHR28 n=1 Tax=Sesamum latifolium TaxID=2727402 RepID=A0AAW2TST5_9LAMI
MVAAHSRHKSNDERVIFRVALQDLSQPKSEATPPDGVLSVPLLKHQRIALSWMVNKETRSACCSGGILADDQGLGKTISTIALILKERSPQSKTPKTNERQSETETLNLDEDDDGALETYHHGAEPCQVNGSPTSGGKASLQAKGRPSGGTLIVCPTSVLRQWSEELHNKVTSEADLSVLVYYGSNRTKDPLELAKYDVVVTTYAIVSMEVPKQPVVDDNDDQIGSPLKEFSSCRKRKLLETMSDKKSSESKKTRKGINNELLENMSGPLAKVGWFRVVLDEAQSIKNHRTQVARACWGLRAKRRWCLSGTPIQNAIDDLYSYFRFLRHEPYAVFRTFCEQLKVPIHRSPKNGYKKLQAVLKTIMLRRTKGTLIDGEPIINLPPKTIELKKVDFSKEERDFYCRLEAESRAQFAEYAAAGTVKQNYVNILLMLLRLRQACDHPLLVKGFSSNSKMTSSIEMAKKLSREKQISLLNCLEASLAICGICSDPPEDAVVTVCGHVFCNQCICEHIIGDDTQCPTKKCKTSLTMSCVFSTTTLRIALADKLNVANTANSEVAEVSEPRLLSCPEDSSKIKAALDLLLSLSKPQDCAREQMAQSSFMEWTGMLDLLEACLKKSSIHYRRLDGTMPVAARDRAVKDFNSLPQVSVMIMSLKAASLGLNMVAACNVILLDLWWNPTTEDQAIDRAHRIGQKRPVSVFRLTVKDTVEDRILLLQQRKRKMVSSAFGRTRQVADRRGLQWKI